jgi:glycosyltransferase involved in cell wall biosynthesis
MQDPAQRRRYRSISISDLHLGTRGCRSDFLVSFLRSVDCKQLYVVGDAGRVTIEKNIDAFLALDLPGTKVVVGDGPALAELKRRFPDAIYTGYRENGALVSAYAGANVFVFPSRTDTFGLVLLEALASGTPVAAFPVMGPKDVVTDPRIGALDEDLRAACLRALDGDRDACRRHAEAWSWQACAAQFRATLVQVGASSARSTPASG